MSINILSVLCNENIYDNSWAIRGHLCSETTPRRWIYINVNNKQKASTNLCRPFVLARQRRLLSGSPEVAPLATVAVGHATSIILFLLAIGDYLKACSLHIHCTFQLNNLTLGNDIFLLFHNSLRDPPYPSL